LFPQFFITNNNINNNNFIAFAKILRSFNNISTPSNDRVTHEDDQKRLHVLHV